MTNERMSTYDGGLDTTYLRVYNLDDTATVVVTFFPDTDDEVEVEMTMEEFYDRLVVTDGDSVLEDFEED